MLAKAASAIAGYLQQESVVPAAAAAEHAALVNASLQSLCLPSATKTLSSPPAAPLLPSLLGSPSPCMNLPYGVNA
jgi:hypothetical protein